MGNILKEGTRKWAQQLCIMEYGDTLENLLAKIDKDANQQIKKVQAEIKKIRAETKKAQAELQQNERKLKKLYEINSAVIRRFYFEKSWTIDEIAHIFELDGTVIEAIVTAPK